MWQQVGRRIFFGGATRDYGFSTNDKNSRLVAQKNGNEPRLDRANSLPKFIETIRASEWYNNLDSGGKILLEKMIVDFSLQGVKAKTVIKLIAQKFNISLQLARDFIDFRSQAKSSPLLDLKKSPKMPFNSEAKLAKWEKKAIYSKHNYGDEIFTRLLYEEKKQETRWHVVREDVVEFSIFAAIRRKCVQVVTNFSFKYRLRLKTTEASFVYLDRFLLLPVARTILDSESGVKGATGKHSLLAVFMCLLMFSSKYEEIYPPELALFAKYVQYSPQEFVKLEVLILHAMNWDLITVTSADYIARFFDAVNCSRKTNFLAMFILEASWIADMSCGSDISIFKPGTLGWLESGRNKTAPGCILHVAKPSEIALGCIILSLAYQGKICYPATLEHAAGLSVDSISQIVKQLHMQLRAVTEKHVTHSSTVVQKYSMRRYQYIGAFKPPSFHELLEHNAFRGTKLFGMYSYASPIHQKVKGF